MQVENLDPSISRVEHGQRVTRNGDCHGTPELPGRSASAAFAPVLKDAAIEIERIDHVNRRIAEIKPVSSKRDPARRLKIILASYLAKIASKLALFVEDGDQSPTRITDVRVASPIHGNSRRHVQV